MNEKYYYLRTDVAKNNGLACMVAVQEDKINNYRDFFNKQHSVDVVEYIGEHVPANITYIEESHSIIEATKQEAYDKGNYKPTESEYVKDGVVKNIPPVDMSLAKPIFNEELEIWVEGATLEEVKKYKRGELQNEREFRIVAPYEYNTVIYQADLNSQDKFFKAMQLGKGKEQPIEWIALDNSTHLLTNNDLINIVNGISERELESFNNFNAIYATVAACESVEEVKSIFWY